MALPPGTPMLQSLATGNWTKVDNVFVSEGQVNCIVICNMDPWQRGPCTDHVPVLTMVELEVLVREEEACRNFRETEWDDFREELAKQLTHIPGPQRLCTDAQFQKAVDDLTLAVQETIDAVVPISKLTPFSGCWWSKQLASLKKAMNRLKNVCTQ